MHPPLLTLSFHSRPIPPLPPSNSPLLLPTTTSTILGANVSFSLHYIIERQDQSKYTMQDVNCCSWENLLKYIPNRSHVLLVRPFVSKISGGQKVQASI